MAITYHPRVYSPKRVEALDGRLSELPSRQHFLDEKIVYNDSEEAVYVVWRDGLVHYVPPVRTPGPNNRLRFHRFVHSDTLASPHPDERDTNRVIFDCTDTILSDKTLAPARSSIQSVMKLSTINCLRHKAISGVSSGYDIGITTHEIREWTQPAYIEDFDVVVMRAAGCNPNELYHPYSAKGKTLAGLNSPATRLYCANFSQFVEIVDNEGRIGDRWINFSGMAFKVTALKDEARSDGVYYTHTRKEGGTFSAAHMVVEHFDPLDDSKPHPLRVFRTEDEALTFGDPKALFEQWQQDKKAEHFEASAQRSAEMEKNKLDANKISYLRKVTEGWTTMGVLLITALAALVKILATRVATA